MNYHKTSKFARPIHRTDRWDIAILKRIFPVLIATLLITLFVSVDMAEAVNERINHIPIITARVSTPITISATIESGTSFPIEARVYYRRSTYSTFLTKDLIVEGNDIRGNIPAREVVPPDIEYYIEVDMDDGSQVIFPVNAPDRVPPLRVDIRDIVEVPQQLASDILILSPAPGERIIGAEVLIALTFLQTDEKINLKSVRVLLDGVDVTKRGKFLENVMSIHLKNVAPGSHNIVVAGEVDGKVVRLAEWRFVSRPETYRPPIDLPVKGRIAFGGGIEEISSQKRDVGFMDARIFGKVGKMDWLTRVYITSLESSDMQPQNRFLALISTENIAIRVGDTSPRFSEFSLWGVRTRGFEYNYRSKEINLDIAWGQSRRSVEGFGTFDTLQVDQDLYPDSLEIKRVIERQGVFSRNILAIRPGIPLSKHSAWSFNILKVKDDTESIDWGAAPKDNLVLGTDLKIQSQNRRFLFVTEAAISLYNSDISSGPLDNAKDLENIIVINRFFDPLPPDSSILDSESDVMDNVNVLFKELTKSALALRSSLTLNYFHNELQFSYKSIGRSFRTLGSPSVMTDVVGFGIQDRIRLMNNRLYLTLGYETYDNNVNKRSQYTISRNIIRGNVAYYTAPSLPNVSFGMRLYDRDNDGELISQVLHDGDTLFIDTRIEQATSSYNFWIDQSFKYLGWNHTAILSYNSTASEDKIMEGLNSDIGGINLSLVSNLGQIWETRLSYGNNNQNSMSKAEQNKYNNISGSLRYTLIPRMLWLNGGINVNFASGGNDLVNELPDSTDFDNTERSKHLDYSRWQLNAGADYKISNAHEVNFYVSKSFHSDDSKMVFYSGREEYSKDREGYRKQNDFVMRLRYTFTF